LLSESAAIEHERGGYAFVPGLGFASSGVVARPGVTIVRAILPRPVVLPEAYDVVERHLDHVGRPLSALCGFELRSPAVVGLDAFLSFNREYLAQLATWGLLNDQDSPLARTNVVPRTNPPLSPSLLGFSYTAEARTSSAAFVISGVAELPDGANYPRDIVRRGQVDSDALLEKATFIAQRLHTIAASLGVAWDATTSVHLYSQQPIALMVQREVLGRLGPAPAHGVTWHDAAPPLLELELELDLRRHGAEELVVE
jgi:hypothetical protein